MAQIGAIHLRADTPVPTLEWTYHTEGANLPLTWSGGASLGSIETRLVAEIPPSNTNKKTVRHFLAILPLPPELRGDNRFALLNELKDQWRNKRIELQESDTQLVFTSTRIANRTYEISVSSSRSLSPN